MNVYRLSLGKGCEHARACTVVETESDAPVIKKRGEKSNECARACTVVETESDALVIIIIIMSVPPLRCLLLSQQPCRIQIFYDLLTALHNPTRPCLLRAALSLSLCRPTPPSPPAAVMIRIPPLPSQALLLPAADATSSHSPPTLTPYP